MGERTLYQPLTREDKITVVLYRTGIVVSMLILVKTALLSSGLLGMPAWLRPETVENILLIGLHVSVGLSVFFIHLYVGSFHRALKKIYYASLLCLAALFLLGNGDPATALLTTPHYPALLLIPIALCLGFVAAKEAFCFRLIEGYVLAIIMPAYILYYAVGLSTPRGNATGLGIVALLMVIFTFRKVFQPLHFDIGDKSAYQP